MSLTSSKRNGVIDLMRFVFCMVIVLFHARNLGGSTETALFGDAGYIGVEFFFIVSGFLMAKSAARRANEPLDSLGRETTVFIWNKIKPLLFFYVLAVICSYSCTVVTKNFTVSQSVHNFLLGIWDLSFLRASGIKTYGLVRATWYLSAMFISMLALYPLLRRLKDQFTHILAPLITIFFLGFLSQKFGNLDQYVNHYAFIFTGVMRALAEISLGCICYAVCEKLRTMNLTLFARILITLTQIAGYGAVLYWATDLPMKQFDFVMVAFLAVSITLSFSGQGILVPLFHGSFFTLLGKLSMVIYLNHMWIKDLLAKLLPKSMGYVKLILIFICCTILVSVTVLFIEKAVTRLWNRCGQTVRNWFCKKPTEA